jgi:hypothetical protein
MVTSLKIERSSNQRAPLFGLASYELNKGPIKHLISKRQATDLLSNHSLLGRTCFQQLLAYVQELKLTVIDCKPAFRIPFNESVLAEASLILSKPPVELDKKFSAYPQLDCDLLKSQSILLVHYKKYLNRVFTQPIMLRLEEMINREYPDFRGPRKEVVSES